MDEQEECRHAFKMDNRNFEIGTEVYRRYCIYCLHRQVGRQVAYYVWDDE